MSNAVAISADYGYITPAETLIKSIAYHNHDLPIYLLNTNIPQEWFLNINQRLAPLHIPVIDAKFSDQVLAHQHVSRPNLLNTMTYGRLLIPRLIPAERVLYIDADCIVDRPLQSLFATDLAGKMVGAVTDFTMAGTFNAGVLLLDNARLKTIDHFTEELLAKGQEPSSNDDQTLLNQYFADQWLPLNPGNNLQVGLETTVFYTEHDLLPRFYHLLAEGQPATIIHYSTYDKPWNFLSASRFREKWWQYHDLDYYEINHRIALPRVRRQALIRLLTFTQSANLDNLEPLLQALPDCEFNVAAWTNMAEPLITLTRYPNLHLFPTIVEANLDQLIDHATAYLDINQGGKEFKFMERCAKLNKPILSYQEYPDHPEIMTKLQQFDREQPDQLIAAIKQL